MGAEELAGACRGSPGSSAGECAISVLRRGLSPCARHAPEITKAGLHDVACPASTIVRTRAGLDRVSWLGARGLHLLCECQDRMSSGLQRGEGTIELVARGDGEFAVCAREVHFDGLGREVERLGDLAVGEAVGGESGDAPLARASSRGRDCSGFNHLDSAAGHASACRVARPPVRHRS